MIIITNKQNYIIKNNAVESITSNQIILIIMTLQSFITGLTSFQMLSIDLRHEILENLEI